MSNATEAMQAEWCPDVVIYHGPGCMDGFAAAWACWRKWGDDGGEKAPYKTGPVYVPMQYGGALPDIEGKRVLMVDYSLKRPAMIEAAKLAKSIVVLDHHKSAEKEFGNQEGALRGHWLDQDDFGLSLVCCSMPTIDLVDYWLSADHHGDDVDLSTLSWVHKLFVGFDMSKSGARLAWEFCHPGEPMPRLLEHIEDRDLFRHALRLTEEISKALHSYPATFHAFDNWVMGSGLARLEHEGIPILRHHTKLVAELCSKSYMEEVAGHTVPDLNCPGQYASDCGNKLLELHPDAPFAATWARKGNGVEAWSLRSRKGGTNVAEIAATLGGGGHPAAAGFSRVAP